MSGPEDSALWSRINGAICAARLPNPGTSLSPALCHGHGPEDIARVFASFSGHLTESAVSDTERRDVAVSTDFRDIVDAELELHAATEKLNRTVREALENGSSWTSVAVALGISVSEAKHRFGVAPEAPRPGRWPWFRTHRPDTEQSL